MSAGIRPRIGVLPALIVLCLCSCVPVADIELLADAATSVELPPAHLEGVVFEGYRAGSREFQVRAASAVVPVDGGNAVLRDVQISFEDPLRGPVSIAAQTAEINLHSDDFVLRGGVEGATRDGERFVTDEVRYRNDKGLLWTDQPVRVYRSNLTLEGDGMEFDVKTQRLKVIGRVRTVVQPR